jgi:hypothetical protein
MLEGHEGCVNTVAFDPTGALLVSGSDDQTVRVWDWEQGDPRSTMHGGGGRQLQPYPIRVTHPCCGGQRACRPRWPPSWCHLRLSPSAAALQRARGPAPLARAAPQAPRRCAGTAGTGTTCSKRVFCRALPTLCLCPAPPMARCGGPGFACPGCSSGRRRARRGGGGALVLALAGARLARGGRGRGRRRGSSAHGRLPPLPPPGWLSRRQAFPPAPPLTPPVRPPPVVPPVPPAD